MLGTLHGRILFALMCAGVTFAQSASVDAATWAAGMRSEYRIAANLSYADGNPRALLDVWWPNSASAKSPVPAAIFIHGGGWMGGDKAGAALWFLPYLEMGWAVVNVEYRGGVGTAPAAVEDCRCALRWVIRNARRYHLDVHNLVVTGESAGSHLALLTGMLPASAGFERSCPGAEELKIAAVINWYGVTDVMDLIDGANTRPFAVDWLQGAPAAKDLARRVSPLSYVRTGLPPILTVHGDADTVAPHSQAARLHKALDEAKVPNRLLTIPGGRHGGFPRDDSVRIHTAIRGFLKEHRISK